MSRSVEREDSAAQILRVLHEVGHTLRAVLDAVVSCDGRLARIEAALDRLEGSVVLDAGHQIDGTTVH